MICGVYASVRKQTVKFGPQYSRRRRKASPPRMYVLNYSQNGFKRLKDVMNIEIKMCFY